MSGIRPFQPVAERTTESRHECRRARRRPERRARRPRGIYVAEVQAQPNESTTPSSTDVLANPHVRVGQWVALAFVLFMVFTQVLFPAPVGVLVQGAINGAIFSLTALGI